MVTSPKNCIAESLVKTTIGLSLSGGLNLYQRISPLSITRSTLVHFPKRQTRLLQRDISYSPRGAAFPFL
jgi:hypothetical protein